MFRELSLEEDKDEEDFVFLILWWESVLKAVVVSCWVRIIPLVSVASLSSSSRNPCAVRGRAT